jgi:hypothetical protein
MDVNANSLDFTVAYSAESDGGNLSGDFKIFLNIRYPEATDQI